MEMYRTIFSELLTTGFSMAMMIVLTNVGSVILQGSINSFGTATITGHTAARKFHDLCMLPLGTICTSSATFVSQNYRAKKERTHSSGYQSKYLSWNCLRYSGFDDCINLWFRIDACIDWFQ